MLVVDDHPSFRGCARRLLVSEGFDVVGEAENGAAALTLAVELSPDLVLLDVQLSDSDGFEIAARLLAKIPKLKIVLVSSRDRCSYGKAVEKSGVAGFVSKAELSAAALERLLE